MTKDELLFRIIGIKQDINFNAYMDDWDGDDEDGRPINRKVFISMTEDDVKNIIKHIDNLIELIKNNDIKG